MMGVLANGSRLPSLPSCRLAVWPSHSRLTTPYRPSAGGEGDGAIGGEGEGGVKVLAERGLAGCVERHGVGGRRALAAEEGRPVIIEAGKVGRDVDGPGGDIAQPRAGKERRQRLGVAYLPEATPFIELPRRGIE